MYAENQPVVLPPMLKYLPQQSQGMSKQIPEANVSFVEKVYRKHRLLIPTQYQSPVESHIRIQRATDEKQGDPDGGLPEPFVRKESLQCDIEESSPRTSPVPPTTFAEAIMVARQRGRVHPRLGSEDGGSFDTIAGPLSAEALGPFKYVLKKKKKFSRLTRFQATAADTEDEASEVESYADSRIEFDQLDSSLPTSKDDKHFSSINDAPPNIGDKKNLDSRQCTSPVISNQHYANPFDEGKGEPVSDRSQFETTLSRRTTSPRPFISAASDSKSMENTNALDYGFDTLEWDPDLAAASRDNSPEPITVKPQRVAYTTVGSLVNPDVVPQFTAPNRIQREGSGRRSQANEGSTRRTQPSRDHHGSYYTSHGPPPLSAANSMQYTQQILVNVNYNENTASRSSGFLGPFKQDESFQRLRDLALPRVRAGNVKTSILNRPSSASSSASNQQSSFKRVSETEEDQSAKGYKEIAGLEKMQTLQRMAKYDNPFQQIARERLAEFIAPLKPQTFPVENISDSPTAATEGELDRSYRFPSDLNTATDPNPLMGALREHSRYTNPEQALTYRPGYPQPLTAGPPGQRPVYTTTKSTNRQLGTAQSPWSPLAYQEGFYRLEDSTPSSSHLDSAVHSKRPTTLPSSAYRESNHKQSWNTIDTLPVSAILQYYPESLAPDMDGSYRSLAPKVQEEMDQVSAQTWSKDFNRAKRVKDVDDWFYHGQRKYGMTIDDHILELEDIHRGEHDEQEPANTFGSIRPPHRQLPPLECAPYTIEEMNNMSTAEAATKLVHGAFGTLLAYADNSSTSRSKKSGFVKSPPWQIDSSEKGNDSFFGEDWGPPPKRFGRDPRYQPTFHNPSSTHWE
ncbi:hypothetical protein BP6252_05654 [Coleophoma cylindrospora]|uniref:Uncharacterized protein n=1 Tax=Coleophoma cylindrospora TaxID=1849047 RepID=A0A3D8RUX1_9HELO|nr:hypothetical protein BP6252_05654 [Coleophoma cylindrospora]